MIKELVAYQKCHMVDYYDWNKIGKGESLLLIHLAATSYSYDSYEVVSELLNIDGVDPSIKVGDPAKNSAEMSLCFRRMIEEHMVKKQQENCLLADVDNLSSKKDLSLPLTHPSSAVADNVGRSFKHVIP